MYGLVLLCVLAGTLLLTSKWTDPPPTPGLSREPIFADYAIPVTRVGTTASSARAYEAQTAFWFLLPDGWRNAADWRLYLTQSAAAPVSVYVEGEKLEIRDSTDPTEGPFYPVPSRLIRATTSLVVEGPSTSEPRFYLHWNRSYIYPPGPAAQFGDGLLQLDGSSIPVQEQGARLEACQPGYSSSTPFIKWCGQGEQVLTEDGSGSAVASLGRAWPTPEASISFWVKPFSTTGHFNLFSNGDDATKNLSLDVAIDDFTRPGTILVFVSVDGVSRDVLVGNHTVPTNLWSQIAISFSDRDVTLYVNGAPDGQLRLNALVHPTTIPLHLGSAFTSPDHTSYNFDGQLAAVRLGTKAVGPEAQRVDYMSDAAKDPLGYLSLPGSHFDASTDSQTLRPWWQVHIVATVVVAIIYLLGFGLLTSWCVREIRARLRRSAVVAVVGGIAGLIAASTFTTNYDVQLFKGLGEGYWINGPLPALALNGYGPVIDLLLTVPMLPYVLLSHWTGLYSELALNLAIRLPFLVGWLFFVSCASRLTSVLGHETANRLPWLLLILNPLALFMTLWQPEAFLVGLVLLSFATLFEGRPAVAGIVLGIAFAGKYWPVVVGPILFIAAWRLLSPRDALRFFVAACSTAVAVFAVYWVPTAFLLGSPSQFVALLITRMPYFGGAQAADVATLWSLYSFPKEMLPAVLTTAVSAAERTSFLFVLIAYFGVLATCFRGVMSHRRALLASGGMLALLAGLNSLSVAQFGLWSLPFILIASVGSRVRIAYLSLAIGVSLSGTGVFLFAEPISYLLLHVSSAQDQFAYTTGAWLQLHVVNPQTARLLGFLFASQLVLAAAYMLAGASLGNTATNQRPTPSEEISAAA